MDALTPRAKQEVIKASPAIHIQNNITLLQRRAWNVLLAHAYDNLLHKEIHFIRVRELAATLEFDSKNDQYIKESLEALVSCRVRWNILNKDGNEQWGVSGLLASSVIENGICEYAYSPHLRERLHNPRMYARICLSLQNRFEGKHAQALWELCVDYLGAAREHGETPYITLEQFKELMGVVDSYPQFMRLNSKVIKPAIAEIHQVSDLRISVDYRRAGRKVVGLKFKIHRVAMLPDANSRQTSLFPDLEDMPTAVKLLKDAGLANNDAWEFWQKGFEFVHPDARPAGGGDNPEEALTRYVREKVHLLEQRQKSGKVANPSGFLMTALRKNYSNAQFEKEEVAQQRAEKIRRMRKLLKDRDGVKQEQDTALHELTGKIIDAFPAQLDKAVEELLAEGVAGFAYGYQKNKTPMENYREHRGIAVAVGTWLEKRFAEQYGEVRQPYQKRLAEIEEQIGALEAEGISAKHLAFIENTCENRSQSAKHLRTMP
jgi:hypothetical protein